MCASFILSEFKMSIAEDIKKIREYLAEFRSMGWTKKFSTEKILTTKNLKDHLGDYNAMMAIIARNYNPKHTFKNNFTKAELDEIQALKFNEIQTKKYHTKEQQHLTEVAERVYKYLMRTAANPKYKAPAYMSDKEERQYAYFQVAYKKYGTALFTRINELHSWVAPNLSKGIQFWEQRYSHWQEGKALSKYHDYATKLYELIKNGGAWSGLAQKWGSNFAYIKREQQLNLANYNNGFNIVHKISTSTNLNQVIKALSYYYSAADAQKFRLALKHYTEARFLQRADIIGEMAHINSEQSLITSWLNDFYSAGAIYVPPYNNTNIDDYVFSAQQTAKQITGELQSLNSLLADYSKDCKILTQDSIAAKVSDGIYNYAINRPDQTYTLNNDFFSDNRARAVNFDSVLNIALPAIIQKFTDYCWNIRNGLFTVQINKNNADSSSFISNILDLATMFTNGLGLVGAFDKMSITAAKTASAAKKGSANLEKRDQYVAIFGFIDSSTSSFNNYYNKLATNSGSSANLLDVRNYFSNFVSTQITNGTPKGLTQKTGAAIAKFMVAFKSLMQNLTLAGDHSTDVIWSSGRNSTGYNWSGEPQGYNPTNVTWMKDTNNYGGWGTGYQAYDNMEYAFAPDNNNYSCTLYVRAHSLSSSFDSHVPTHDNYYTAIIGYNSK